ncbi:hypothetical protein BJX63DRAFT_432037 [Aspergillus granulosus]|uniref:Uncharacterized protein n=1 Tax=Aspergillus granulosus TaxID=176169 RepID=A0ABR4HEQ0_9EURO
MDHDISMENAPSQSLHEKDSQNETSEPIIIPWSIDQPGTNNDSTSTQKPNETPIASLIHNSPEPLQIDIENLMNLSQTFHILPTPEDDDDLERTVNKVRRLAEVVEQGNSLALWTGMKLVPEFTRDAESIAMAQMASDEREVYEMWKEWATSRKGGNLNTTVAGNTSHEVTGPSQNSFRLPEFNWEQNVSPVPQGAQSLKKFTQRAAAMDIIFRHQGATPENAAWLTFNMVPVLPLVKAVTRISNMERHFLENRYKNKNTSMQRLSNVEAAEMETARKIVAAAERNTNRELERLRRMTRELNKSNAIIRARMRELEGKGGNGGGVELEGIYNS